jgi:ligand-binding sensor domain-containing protein/signal transduction histidine kinase
MGRVIAIFAALLVAALPVVPARAVVLWSDLGATLVHDTGAGSSFLIGSAMDILGGTVREDHSSSDTLYFKFHVDPLSDASTEEYFAAFQLFEDNQERLGVGNSMKAWAYSVFNTSETVNNDKVFGDVDLKSLHGETTAPGVVLSYELPRRGVERTIVFKVQYMTNADAQVTVWLDPDLSAGATEEQQPEGLTTRFRANCAFNQIRLRHGGGGGGWTFSDMAIATTFADFTGVKNPESADASHLMFQSWQREQGLPQNSVHALAQTRDGYLWIGSDEGVARFDGVRFVPIDMGEGLRRGPVQVLFEDTWGALWVGTGGGGLTRWQNGQIDHYTTRDGLPDDAVISLNEDTQGRVWIGTESGLAIWDRGTFSEPAAAEFLKGHPVSTILRDRDGICWVGVTGMGVFRYVSGKFLPLLEPSVEDLLRDPHCLLVDRVGRIWVGAGDDYVLCCEGSDWRRYRIPRHLTRPFVGCLVEQPNGTVWAGSASEGLFQFKNGKLTVLNANNGLLDNFVQALLVDRDGQLWVGTGAGLSRLRRSNLSILSSSEGLGYGAVQGMVELAPGVIWAAKPSDGLYGWNGRGFARVNIPGLSHEFSEVNSLLKTRDGSCWAGGAFGLLELKHPGPTNAELGRYALQGKNVTALAEDKDGRLWAGTREGSVFEMVEGQWGGLADFTRGHAVTALAAAPDDSLWIGTAGNGLYHRRGKEFEHYDASHGPVSDLIRTLCLDKHGDLWIGTGGGLSRLHNGQVAAFTAHEGLPESFVSQILEDDFNRLWLGGGWGIASIPRRDLEELAVGKMPAVYPRLYGKGDGMLSEECTGGFFPAGLKTASGQLWFATYKGIAVIRPGPFIADSPAPLVIIEDMSVDGGPVTNLFITATSESTVRLPAGKHRIEFRYTGLSFGAPDRVRFRCRLDGLEPDWVEAGTRRTAVYYVPPGRYQFRVTACNSDGAWNEAGVAAALEIPAHFWQARWFFGLVAATMLASVGGAVRFIGHRKLRQRLKLLEQERALERERGRIAQDLHDELGSSLARLSLLSGLVKADKDSPAQVESHAQKLAQSADQTVRALEEIVWAVRPGSDTLQGLVDYLAHFATELFENNPTRCRLDLPQELPAMPLPPDVRHNIFLIAKEALTNVLKHAGANEVRLQIKVAGRALDIAVEDDGKGFDAGAAASAGLRNGLGNLRRRAAAAGGDLKLVSAPGEGTRVQFHVDFTD